ncbi:threonine synthase [Candidatus Woesearchaeota archaeon CG10_big_fil_rev_8_21_14_0_10_44_13]|nr:MAG: threonine synthase [Candidatus Woesearchaeota archaeon CG10_big_fil_rev_8_21_14_0_10_44_13]
MNIISKFRCISCGREYNIKDMIFRCACGDLLEVIHDFSKLKRKPGEWKRLFEENMDKVAFLRYKDLILPSLPDDKVITLDEGDTPLYKANNRLGKFFGIKRLYFKHEGMNPTLSFKDRGMVAGVSWANYFGVKDVACASTGDTSAAMAAYAAYSEKIRGIVLLPKGKISVEQLSQPISFGTTTLGLETDFDGCMQIVKELTAKHPIYLLNSMNPIRIEGQKAIGIEMIHQLDWEVPDWIVVPVGNAGNISAIGKGIREMYELGIISKKPRLAGVQSSSACPLYNSYTKGWSDLEPVKAEKTVASAIQIGNPVSFRKAVRELRYFNGVVEKADEKEIMDCKAFVERNGIPLCPNSAVAAAGALKLRNKNIIKEGESVVIVLTAHSTKFSHAVINYHTDSTNKYANLPIYIKPTLSEVEKTLNLKQ